MMTTISEKQRNITPANPQTQAQQTVVWSKPSVQLPKILNGEERFDGEPIKLKHALVSPGQRRFLVRMECGRCHVPVDVLQRGANVSSPFAAAEDNIARLAKGTRKVVVAPTPEHVEVHNSGGVPWDELFQADNDRLHSSSHVPKFDDMVCTCTCTCTCTCACTCACTAYFSNYITRFGAAAVSRPLHWHAAKRMETQLAAVQVKASWRIRTRSEMFLSSFHNPSTALKPTMAMAMAMGRNTIFYGITVKQAGNCLPL